MTRRQNKDEEETTARARAILAGLADEKGWHCRGCGMDFEWDGEPAYHQPFSYLLKTGLVGRA